MRLRSGKECGDQRLGRSSDKLLRGRKRRLEDSGRFVPAAEVRREEMDAVMEVLLEEGDETMLSGALERILVKQKSALQKDSVLAKARGLGVQLQEVADMLTRQQASQHNSAVWPLTGDLTLKLFSLLGTQWLCRVAASCKMFNNLAMDPACYVDVDMTMIVAYDSYASKVGNPYVNKLVQRAGHNLRSLKLGALPPQNRTPAVPNSAANFSTVLLTVGLPVCPRRRSRDYLTRGCLESLTADGGVAGALLTRLHLFNLEMDSGHLFRAIATCPCLTDLEVVGVFSAYCKGLRPLIECLGSHCPNLNRLCCQAKKAGSSSYPEETLVTKSCNQLIKGCPNISHLAFRGYGVPDKMVNILLEGLPKLTVVDFCGDQKLSGVFLRGVVGPEDQPSQLTRILLCDCRELKESEVERFLIMLVSGECRNLRHLDISCKGVFAVRYRYDKPLSRSTKQAISRVRQERTELCLLAEFPDHNKCSSDGSESDISLDDSDYSGQHPYGSATSESDNSDD